MILRLCKICNKEYKDTHYREMSYTCSKDCRVIYQDVYGKFGLPQRDENGLLLCYTCRSYKEDDEFNILNKKSKCPKSRNRRNTKCRRCLQTQITSRDQSRRETLEGILKSRLANARAGSGKRNIYFDRTLTFYDLIEIYNNQDGKCNLSGEQLEIGSKKTSKLLSLDRIDSSKGYTKNNIQLVCWAVNQMKNNLSEEELFSWCNKIIENQLILV